MIRRLAGRLLTATLPEEMREEILGDLEESTPSNFWYVTQCLSLALRFSIENLRERRAARWHPAAAQQAVSTPTGGTMELAWHDLRHAVRGLVRDPSFSVVVILTLALGIGATTAVYSVVDRVLLRPLSFEEPSRLVMVWENDRHSGTVREAASIPDYYDFLEQNGVFQDIAAVASSSMNFSSPGASPLRLQTASVSHSFDELLGLEFLRGRGFEEAEDQPGGPSVVVLSEGLWRRVFDADPEIVGDTVRLDDVSFTVVGIVAGAPEYPPQTDIWVPLQLGPLSSPRSRHNVNLVARLNDGVAVDEAQSEMAAIALRLEQAYPGHNNGRGVFVEPLGDVLRGQIRPALWVLFGSVIAVLLIACANTANLLMARSTRRLRELAVCTALGASPLQLARRFLFESMLLTGIAWIAGVVAAALGLQALLALAPSTLVGIGDISLDLRVLGFALLISGVISLGFSLLPSLQARRIDLLAGLKGGSRQSAGAPDRLNFQRAMVVVQTGLAVILLTGAGLLINSLWRLQAVDPGFDSESSLRVSFRLPPETYPRNFSVYPDWPEVHGFNNALLATLDEMPGVVDAALTSNHPLDSGFTNSFVIIGRESEAAGQPEMTTRIVSENYFATLRIPVLAGRAFHANDDGSAPRVIAINETAAKRYFPDGDAIGSRIRFWGSEREVVAIVGDEKVFGLAEEAPAAMYASLRQAPQTGQVTLIVRADRDPRLVVTPIRETLLRMDPNLAAYDVETLSATVTGSIARERFTTAILAVFAGVAVFLAAIGVYGVLSYLVAQRRHEVGVRMAIGASQFQIVKLVVGQGMLLALVGVGLGLGGAALLTRSLAYLLYGVSPLDLPTWALATAGLLLAALVACLLPARRASRMDPLRAIRVD